MWATAFLLYFTDTQFWAVLGCSLFGIAVAVKQRFKHPRSLIGTEDTRKSHSVCHAGFCGLTSGRRTGSTERGRMFGTRSCSSCAMRTKIDDEMFKSMVHYKRETKVRWPAFKDVKVTTTNTDGPNLSFRA